MLFDLFDAKGVLVLPTKDELNALSPGDRERFESVLTAWKESRAADIAVEESVGKMGVAVAAFDKAEKYLARNFKVPTFHDLWKSDLQGGKRTV